MKLILVAAISKDGYIADKNNSLDWISKEDGIFFRALLKQYPLQIMGRKTYESEKIVDTPGILRVILTHEPQKYSDTPNMRYYRNSTINELTQDPSLQPYNTALILGGAEVYQQCFEAAHLLDELYITVEPVRLGCGKSLLSSGKSIEDTIQLPPPLSLIHISEPTRPY